jgi:hypothetical protein
MVIRHHLCLCRIHRGGVELVNPRNESQPSLQFRLTILELTTQPGFPAPDAFDKKFNSRLVTPT